jgi:thiol:disulfide interchange protein
MSKITLIFGALLILLGLAGFIGTGSAHPTALIPTWIGLLLALGGWLSISPSESRRKLFAHINVTVGLVAFIGSVVEIFRGIAHAHATGTEINPIALSSKIALAVLLLLYILLCVRSFIAARRSGKV